MLTQIFLGGFFRPSDQYSSADYHELLVRWFQFGAFTPIFRVHGSGTNTEYWNFGPDVEKLVLQICQLRYRLLPYTYTLAWYAHAHHGTMQRHLAFEFPGDSNVHRIADQFLLGASILVAPVLNYQQLNRAVYLPKTVWHHFWSGDVFQGGDVVNIASPIDEIPLLVRAGSIVLMGPFLQYSQELPFDPLEIRIYPGMDAYAELYEDDGVTQAFATRAEHTLISFSWRENARQLTVAARQGSFPGMLASRTLHVVLVHPGHGVGLQPCPSPDSVVTYSGHQVVVQL